ncbi:hypothetical protein [Gymnodinialimonas sp.]
MADSNSLDDIIAPEKILTDILEKVIDKAEDEIVDALFSALGFSGGDDQNAQIIALEEEIVGLLADIEAEIQFSTSNIEGWDSWNYITNKVVDLKQNANDPKGLEAQYEEICKKMPDTLKTFGRAILGNQPFSPSDKPVPSDTVIGQYVSKFVDYIRDNPTGSYVVQDLYYASNAYMTRLFALQINGTMMIVNGYLSMKATGSKASDPEHVKAQIKIALENLTNALDLQNQMLKDLVPSIAQYLVSATVTPTAMLNSSFSMSGSDRQFMSYSGNMAVPFMAKQEGNPVDQTVFLWTDGGEVRLYYDVEGNGGDKQYVAVVYGGFNIPSLTVGGIEAGNSGAQWRLIPVEASRETLYTVYAWHEDKWLIAKSNGETTYNLSVEDGCYWHFGAPPS